MKRDEERGEEGPTSIAFLIALISPRHLSVLPPALISSSSPLSQSLSGPDPPSRTLADVSERRWSCESVTEREELVGRMREVSRLPQLR